MIILEFVPNEFVPNNNCVSGAVLFSLTVFGQHYSRGRLHFFSIGDVPQRRIQSAQAHGGGPKAAIPGGGGTAFLKQPFT